MARRIAPSVLLLMPVLLLTPVVPVGAPGTSAAEAAAGVVVRVSSSGQDAAVYRVEVRNGTPAPADLVVRQSVPRGASVAATSPAAEAPPGRGEVTWNLRVDGRQTAAVSTTFAGTGDTFAAACAYDASDAAPVSCGSASWSAPRPVVVAPPWWRTWAAGALIAVLVVLALVLAVAGRRRPAADAPARRRPPLWTVFLLACTALAGLLVAGAVAAAPRLTSLVGGPSDGDGWVGVAPSGVVGQPLDDHAFTFTAYRLSCAPAPSGSGSRCVAVVGATNRSGAQERWFGQLQRLATADGGWVPVDDAATAAANAGRDVFAGAIQPGGKALVQLVFTVPAGRAATEMELRSGAFADGVRILI